MTTAPSAPENTTSRFRYMDLPYPSPGHCAVCGAADRPVVDFGTNLQRFGAIMLCEFCVCEAAERFGMVRSDVLEAAKVQAGQSIDDYLASTNTRIVSDELYDAWTAFVRLFSADRDSAYGFVDRSSNAAEPENVEAVR